MASSECPPPSFYKYFQKRKFFHFWSPWWTGLSQKCCWLLDSLSGYQISRTAKINDVAKFSNIAKIGNVPEIINSISSKSKAYQPARRIYFGVKIQFGRLRFHKYNRTNKAVPTHWRCHRGWWWNVYDLNSNQNAHKLLKISNLSFKTLHYSKLSNK